MKHYTKLFMPILAMLICFNCLAQDGYKSTKKELGNIGEVKFTQIIYTDLKTDTSLKTIWIYYKPKKLAMSSLMGMVSIKIEHLPKIISGLKYISEQIKRDSAEHEETYSVVTDDDVVLESIYYKKGETKGMKGWFVTLSEQYHYVTGTKPNSTVPIDIKDIDLFIELLQKCI